MTHTPPTDPGLRRHSASPGPGEGHEPTDVIVVGAGIGGLLTSVLLAHGGHRVTLLESHADGGRARADQRGNYLFNRGPRALYVDGAADRTLTQAGVDTSHGSPPMLAGGGARLAGTVHRFPATATDTARTRLLSAGEKLTLARTLAAIMSGVNGVDHLSVAGWLDQRKLTGTVRQLLEALVRLSSYADAPEALAAGPALRSVRAGVKPGVRYLDGGWQSLVDQLGAAARSAGVRRQALKVTAVETRDTTVEVHGSAGERLQARSVVLATGGPEAVIGTLGARPTSWPTLGPPATAACLELGLRRVPTRRFILGIDEPTYLSTHAPPAQLAPEGHAVVHVMRYRRPDDDLAAEETRAQLHGLAAAAGIEPTDVVEERFLARMSVAGAIPLPDASGALGRPPVAVAEHPGVFLVGDWVGPTDLLLDAVAASAGEAARLVAERSATMVG